METSECDTSAFVQKQVPEKRRISNKTPLPLTLSRPTGEGTARPVSRSFQSGWIRRPTEEDSPSPIRWERAGVRVILLQNPKLFWREPLSQFGRSSEDSPAVKYLVEWIFIFLHRQR